MNNIYSSLSRTQSKKLRIKKKELTNGLIILILLLTPYLNLSPYFNFVVTFFCIVFLSKSMASKGLINAEYKSIRKISSCFIAIIAIMFCAQIGIVLGFDRQSIQRAFVGLIEIYISLFVVFFFPKRKIDYGFATNIICIYLNVLSLIYFILIALNGIPNDRDSAFTGFSSNYVAATIYFFYPYLMFVLWKNRKNNCNKKIQKQIIIAFTLSLCVILSTGSRTSYGVVTVIISLGILLTRWDIKKTVKVLGLLIFFAVLIYILIQNNGTIRTLFFRAITVFLDPDVVKTDIRQNIWTLARNAFSNNNCLFGSGSSYIQYYSTDLFEPAHNYYLEIMLANGYVGLFIAIASQLILFLKMFKISNDKNKRVFLIATAVGYILTSYVQPFFSTSFNCGLIAWMTMLLITFYDEGLIYE